jgi:hypothetical protein
MIRRAGHIFGQSPNYCSLVATALTEYVAVPRVQAVKVVAYRIAAAPLVSMVISPLAHALPVVNHTIIPPPAKAALLALVISGTVCVPWELPFVSVHDNWKLTPPLEEFVEHEAA